MLPERAISIDDPSRAHKSTELDDADFERISELVRAQCGIALLASKRSLVVSRLRRRVRALQMADFGAYLDHVSAPSGSEEMRRMLSLLTTNVTRFFREAHHFDAMRTHILPPLLDRARTGAPVRIWSAGCSTGEEPLSLAMEILTLCPEAGALDIRLLCTDLDPVSLNVAKGAIYSAEQLDALPDQMRAGFFEVRDDQKTMRAAPQLRALITYAELNLIDPWPMERAFDVIFCRNVVIYFDADTQAALWPRFADALHPGGALFIGHSERLNRAAHARFEPAGITQYRRI